LLGFGSISLGLSLMLPSAPASAAVGAATVVDTVHGSPLTSGTASTPFSVKLPPFAGCQNPVSPAYSFMVPVGTDVQNLTFTGNPGLPTLAVDGAWLSLANGSAWPGASSSGASNGSAYPLPVPLPNSTFQFDGEWGNNPATQLPIGPGASSAFPTWYLFDTTQGANEGKWLIGVACTVAGKVNPPSGPENLWDVEVDFASAPGGSFTWTVPGTAPIVPEAPLAVALPIGGAAVIGAAVFVSRRRRSPPTGIVISAGRPV
jgi:hypothetical protein